MSKKKVITLSVCMLGLVLVFVGLWRSEVNISQITGNAYLDYGTIGIYDGDPPAAGLVVQLYEFDKDVPIQEAVVDKWGKYEFPRVLPGIYYVQPLAKLPGYPEWNHITTLHSDEILVERGKHYNGPIILVKRWG